jgi:hypothetical protein
MRLSASRVFALSVTGIFVAGLLVAALLSSPRHALSANSISLGGYAWSDTVGWISMNGTNYGLSMDTNGNVTGYAWSDDVGWISANSADIAACQSGATSRIQGGVWSGWLRAIAGNTAQSGGWDGCIAMSGTGYGVTYNSQTGTFGGDAWGSTNVGWADFSQVSTAGACLNLQGDNYCNGASIYQHDVQGNACLISTCSYQCSGGACVAPPHASPGFSDGTALHIVPSIVPQAHTTTISWSIQNVQGTCTVSGTNGDVWHSAADGSANSAGSQTSSPITRQVAYTLSCTGLDSLPYIETHTVNIIPQFREI